MPEGIDGRAAHADGTPRAGRMRLFDARPRRLRSDRSARRVLDGRTAVDFDTTNTEKGARPVARIGRPRTLGVAVRSQIRLAEMDILPVEEQTHPPTGDDRIVLSSSESSEQ